MDNPVDVLSFRNELPSLDLNFKSQIFFFRNELPSLDLWSLCSQRIDLNFIHALGACDALLAKKFFKFFPKILLSLGIISYLCGGSTKGKTVMLGIDSKETPVVTGIYAEEVRDALRRVHLGLPNEAGQKIAARSANIKREYEAVWR